MDIFKNDKLRPMLLIEKTKPFNNKDYLYEIKFDGIRALIYIDKEKIQIKSRNGKIMNELYPELLNIKSITNNKCIFDGEIVLMDKGKPNFSKLLERNRLKNKNKINYYKENYPVTFVVFDILYENKSLIDLELINRKEILSKYNDNDYFIKSRVFDNGIKLFNIVKKNNLEGIVAKLKDSNYIPNKRTDNWIKIKNIKTDDYYICGYKEKDYVVILILGEKVNNKFIYIGKVTIGKKYKDYNLIKKCKQTNNYLTDFIDNSYVFINPKYICTIKYTKKTKNKHLRHPVFLKIRK